MHFQTTADSIGTIYEYLEEYLLSVKSSLVLAGLAKKHIVRNLRTIFNLIIVKSMTTVVVQ